MVINRVLDQKDTIIHIAEQVMAERCNTDAIQSEKNKAQAELEIITGLMERLITVNASVAMDQDEYNRQFAEYETRYNAVKQRISELDAERARLTAKRGQPAAYLEALKTTGPIMRFDETLRHGTVAQLRGMADGKLRFIFKDGKEISV